MIIQGDCRQILPTLDLSDSVIITDPPWDGYSVDIIGSVTARSLWQSVAALLGNARCVVVIQSSLDAPFSAPPLPFWGLVWLRSIPPGYRGEHILSHYAQIWGRPLRPTGKRVFPSEFNSMSTESLAWRRGSGHPCPFSLDHTRSLVRWYGRGRQIIDPFCGSGTTLQAAAEARIPAIGIDCDPRWTQEALDREAAGESQQVCL